MKRLRKHTKKYVELLVKELLGTKKIIMIKLNCELWDLTETLAIHQGLVLW